MDECKYIEVSAEVRYWEDCAVDGVEDQHGTMIPCRDGILWKPIIRLSDGVIINWREGTSADIHYKVCDQGEYWLLDINRRRIMKWRGYYVPTDFLCHGDNGYGDYIIFKVDEKGAIVGWEKPDIVGDEWMPLPAPPKEG